MYLQSHVDVLHIGPAIPTKGIASGSFKNWLARGAFQVSAQWSSGHITSATILAKTSRLMAIRIENGRSFFVNGQQYTQPIQATQGTTYRITF